MTEEQFTKELIRSQKSNWNVKIESHPMVGIVVALESLENSMRLHYHPKEEIEVQFINREGDMDSLHFSQFSTGLSYNLILEFMRDIVLKSQRSKNEKTLNNFKGF